MRTRASRLSLCLTLGAVAFSACDCPEDIDVIAPQIAVEVCSDPKRELNGQILGGVRDCAIDFASSPITVRTEKEFKITNPSPVDLQIYEEDTGFTEDSGLEFAVERIPTLVKAGQTAVGVISYRPLVESDHTGTLIIASDAANLAKGEDVVIHVKGTGFNDGVPDIVVSPLSCEYGRVAVEGVAQCTLTVENRGQRDLVFDDVALLDDQLVVPEDHEGDAAPFTFVGRPPAKDDVLPPPPGDDSPPENVFDLTVRFVPSALGEYQGKLRILTNDPDTPELVVPLAGEGVSPPTCNIGVKSVNGIPGTTTIEPLDDVVLTAEGSLPSDQGGSIASVEWTIVQQPPGSTAVLTNPNGVDTGFTFADGVLGVDLAGRYALQAVVTDDLGTRSINQCELAFEAIPTDTILVQLTWDVPVGDMDLHFMKEHSGQFCTSSSVNPTNGLARGCGTDYACYFGNCKGTGTRPDWDNDGTGDSAGDPSLDIDDLCGYGPENINIDLAEPGAYLVGVDFWGFTGCSGSGSTGNTIRIYIYGALAAEFFADMESGDWWEPAIIYWPEPGEGAPCVEDLSTPEEECPGF